MTPEELREQDLKKKKAEAFAKKQTIPKLDVKSNKVSSSTSIKNPNLKALSESSSTKTADGSGPGGLGDVASGAGTGFAVGGPWGAVIGAGVGVISARSKTEAFNKKLKGDSIRKQGEIAQDTASQSNLAIKNIMDGFRLALLS